MCSAPEMPAPGGAGAQSPKWDLAAALLLPFRSATPSKATPPTPRRTLPARRVLDIAPAIARPSGAPKPPAFPQPLVLADCDVHAAWDAGDDFHTPRRVVQCDLDEHDRSASQTRDAWKVRGAPQTPTPAGPGQVTPRPTGPSFSGPVTPSSERGREVVKYAFEDVFLPGEWLEQGTGRGAVSVEDSQPALLQLNNHAPSPPCSSRPRSVEQDRGLRTEQRVDEQRRVARAMLRAALLAWRAGLAAAWAHASHRRAQLRVVAYRIRLVALRGVFVRMRVSAATSLDAVAGAEHRAGRRGRRGLADAFAAMGEHAAAARDARDARDGQRGGEEQPGGAAGLGGEERADTDLLRVERPRTFADASGRSRCDPHGDGAPPGVGGRVGGIPGVRDPMEMERHPPLEGGERCEPSARTLGAIPVETEGHSERAHPGALCCEGDAGEEGEGGGESISVHAAGTSSGAGGRKDISASSSAIEGEHAATHGQHGAAQGEGERVADRRTADSSYTAGSASRIEEGAGTADRSYDARVAQLQGVAARNLKTAALRSDEADALRAEMAGAQPATP